MSLNKVMLIGNVGTDPEVRYLDGNTKVATFRLATTERFKDRSGETRENTEWHSIVAWRQSADVAERFIRKGTQIYVEGRLRTRTWTDQQGAQHARTEINVDTLRATTPSPPRLPPRAVIRKADTSRADTLKAAGSSRVRRRLQRLQPPRLPPLRLRRPL